MASDSNPASEDGFQGKKLIVVCGGWRGGNGVHALALAESFLCWDVFKVKDDYQPIVSIIHGMLNKDLLAMFERVFQQ